MRTGGSPLGLKPDCGPAVCGGLQLGPQEPISQNTVTEQ